MARRRARVADAPLLDWAEDLRRERVRRRRLRRGASAIIVGTMYLGLTIVFPPRPFLVWNASESAPIGLYALAWDAPVDPGDMVVAQLPQRYRLFAARRHYLPANVPLVKRVAGAAGDEVCAVGREVTVNGAHAAVRRERDRLGRPMPWWSGCVRLKGRQLFLLMDAPASFDGRYFGVTEGSELVGKARLLWLKP